MLTAGGEAIADIDILRHQAGVLGPVASPPTVWRVLDEATPAALKRAEKARTRIRRHVWDLLPRAGIQGCRHRSGRSGGAGRRRYLGAGALGEGSGPGDLSRAATVSIPSGCGATTRRRCSRSRCDQEMPAATTLGTTSRC
jgi:hypothetical protein